MATIPSTISGMTFSQARLIADCEFGCKVLKVECNVDKRKYDVYLAGPINKEDMKTFKKTWNTTFRIIPVRFEDATYVPVNNNENDASDKKTNPSTISGMTHSQAKRIADSKFGEDIMKIDKNLRDKTYDVYVSSLVDKKIVNEFQEKYKNRFHVITVILEPAI